LASGGAGVFVSTCLEYEVRTDLQLHVDRCEDIWINIKLNKRAQKCADNELIIGVVYRHPGSQIKEFEEKICQTISSLIELKNNFVIMGDININFQKVNLVQNITDYYNNLQSSGCLSLINRATRVVRRGSKWQTSCLDHIYTNINSDKTDAYIITSDISDHYSTLLKLNDVRNSYIPKYDIFVRKKNPQPG